MTADSARMIAPLDHRRFPIAAAFIDHWRAPYSSKRIEFLTRLLALSILRGIPSPLD